MDALTNFGLEAIAWLQSTYPQLAGIMVFFTTLGNEEFYLALLPIFYWCIDKRVGKELNYFFFLNVALNTLLKQAFRSPRPYWIDPSLAEEQTPGFGIPSGHAQYSTILYLYLAAWIRKTWAWILAVFLILAIGFSRIYLGQHFIQDVIFGYLVGLLALGALFLWKRYLSPGFRKRILGQKMLVAVIVPLLIAALYVGLRLLLGPVDMTQPYADWIVAADLASLNETMLAIAVLFGAGVGFLLEGVRLRFRADGPLAKRVARYALGIVGMLAIYLGLGELFPREPLIIGVPLRLLRYGLLGFWAAYWAPWLFTKLRLADRDPDPGINISLRDAGQ